MAFTASTHPVTYEQVYPDIRLDGVKREVERCSSAALLTCTFVNRLLHLRLYHNALYQHSS